MEMARIHMQSLSTDLDGIEKEHKVQLKNGVDQVHKEFQAQLASIRSENDAKVNDLMKEIHNLKQSLITETTVHMILI
jgi:gas vesicle protein